jgi:polyisoprenyl-phosphate glycosyltransferase
MPSPHRRDVGPAAARLDDRRAPDPLDAASHDADGVGQPTVSIVVPVKDEQESIEAFLVAVFPHVDGLPIDVELLFVDDGSTDGTLDEIERMARRDERIRYLKLARNFGKEAAMTAGLDHAVGDAVIVMDVDLQDPPELLAEFVRLWRDEGYKVVYGTRVARREDSASKRITAGLFYRFFNRVSAIDIPSNAGDFRLLDRVVVDTLKSLPERNRFMKGLCAWPGYASVSVPYERRRRQAGKTKYSYWKLWNFAWDGITSFSTLPLRVWSYLGGVVGLLSLLYMSLIIVRTVLFGRDVPGYASLMSAVLFFGALQLLSIGVLGEYVGRLVVESKQRPVYIVERDSRRRAASQPGAVP